MDTVAVDSIVQELEALAKERPELKEAARIYATLLPLLRDADLHVTPVAITPVEAKAKLTAGKPLLQDEDLFLDDAAAAQLMVALARALEKVSPEKATWFTQSPPSPPTPKSETGPKPPRTRTRHAAARDIRLALERKRVDTSDLFERAAAGDQRYVTTLAESLHLDPALLWILAQNALKPALRAWARQLADLARDLDWTKDSCPICGAVATLGELQGNEGTRHLRCGQCGADWTSTPLKCVRCGNEDCNTLGHLYAETEREKMRVDVCEKCKGYLKVVKTSEPTPADQLAIVDLATLHLDYVARDGGYFPPR